MTHLRPVWAIIPGDLIDLGGDKYAAIQTSPTSRSNSNSSWFPV